MDKRARTQSILLSHLDEPLPISWEYDAFGQMISNLTSFKELESGPSLRDNSRRPRSSLEPSPAFRQYLKGGKDSLEFKQGRSTRLVYKRSPSCNNDKMAKARSHNGKSTSQSISKAKR